MQATGRTQKMYETNLRRSNNQWQWNTKNITTTKNIYIRNIRQNCSQQQFLTERCDAPVPIRVCVMLYLWGSTLNLVKVERFYYLYMRHTRASGPHWHNYTTLDDEAALTVIFLSCTNWYSSESERCANGTQCAPFFSLVFFFVFTSFNSSQLFSAF